MDTQHFSIHEARQIDLVTYLEKLGYQSQKIRNNDYWYLSPLRNEKEPSFKVNRKLNAWYDHGLGQGGNLIDFGILYHSCSVAELLNKLEKIFNFHQQTPTIQPHQSFTHSPADALESKIKVIAAKPLTHPSLCRYLEDRKIPLEIAKRHCKEVQFELHEKKYFAVGFENQSGGFELRNRYFKCGNSPKDITLIEHPNAKHLTVFEGFFSFLSYEVLNEKEQQPLTNFLVLNSLSFFKKSEELMEKFERVYLYLGQDLAGRKHTMEALKRDPKYIDESHRYKHHKDLNDYLVYQSCKLKNGNTLSSHL